MDKQVFDFVKDFCGILWEAFPFIVLGALIAGILEEVVPQQAITRIIPKSKLGAISLGGILGLVFPMCECGIVPVMRRLLRKGLPLGTCIAYMLAGPIVNFVVILSTWTAFQGGNADKIPQLESLSRTLGLEPGSIQLGYFMVALRVGLGFLIAVTTGFIVDRQYQKYGNKLLTPLAMPQTSEKSTSLNVISTPDVHPAEERAGKKVPLFKRLSNISETALHDFIDIMVFLTLGAAIAAFAKTQLTNEDVSNLTNKHPILILLAMMGLAVVLCLCSEADAFVAASFKTLEPAGKIAFLVLGPMFDFKLLMMFTRVFRRRLIITIIISVFIQVLIYSYLVHLLWVGLTPRDMGVTTTE
jgi:uncharacterized membrane protein YraQ (UPF0718 family)